MAMDSSIPRSESDLLTAATSGDRDALAKLLEQCGPAVRRSLAGRIDKRWRSVLSEDDVMQETYVDAFRSIHQFAPRGKGAFVRWLTTLARNNLLDAVKGLQTAKKGGERIRVQPDWLEDSHADLLDQLSGGKTSPSGAARRTEAKQLLEEAVEKMPASYQQVVRLYDLEGRSAECVARLLGCSPGAVSMRRARAHALLRELLGSQSRF